MTDPMSGSIDGNETTSQWIQDYLLSRPVRRSFSCLWEQALYDPLTAIMLPPLAKLLLHFGVFALVAILANTLSPDGTDDGSEWKKAQQKRRTWARRRRQTLLRWLSVHHVQSWLKALPIHSIAFAYVASITTQTAVEVGFLRLPSNITHADWFENCAKLTKALLLWIKITNLGVIVFSIVFSETAITRVSQLLNQCRPAGEKIELKRSTVAVVTACQLVLWTASYAAVAMSALLLFVCILTFLVAQLPVLIYSKSMYTRLHGTFIGRYLNKEVEKFFKDHEFLRVADDFKSLVLPFAGLSFMMQVNLLLCSHELVSQTRRRLVRYSLLRNLDLQLRFAGLRQRFCDHGGGSKKVMLQKQMEDGREGAVVKIAPVVQEKLQSALVRAKAQKRMRRGKRGGGGGSIEVAQPSKQQVKGIKGHV